MNSQHEAVFAALAAPFEPGEVKQLKHSGRSMDYVTARTVMNRLDDVVGPENWEDEYVPLEHSVICKLSLKLPGGQRLTKTDAGGYAGMADAGDDEKSGVSDAFKRAAVKFGVGRYLYRDGVPRVKGDAITRTEVRSPGPEKTGPVKVASPQAAGPPDFKLIAKAGTGSFYYWARDVGAHFGVNLTDMIGGIARQDGLPSEWKAWDQVIVDSMYYRTATYCKKLKNYKGEFDSASDSIIRGLQSNLWMFGVILQLRIAPGVAIKPEDDEEVQILIHGLSEGRIVRYRECKDEAVLNSTIKAIREKTASYDSSGSD